MVGPNGSGKSNLMESLLFVFGKRAKKMRLSKLSDLIHNSASLKSLRYARVSIFFKEIKEKARKILKFFVQKLKMKNGHFYTEDQFKYCDFSVL